MKTPTKNKEEGFTIIEVMIVLAIAALIMVVVLVAIPQLQSNQRNNARQSIAARITTEINNFAGNNNGRYPEDPSLTRGDWEDDFVARYADSDTAYQDPLTDVNIARTAMTNGTDLIDGNHEPGTASYHVGAICQGESVTTDTAQGARDRNFAFQVRLEGGAVYCLDNQ